MRAVEAGQAASTSSAIQAYCVIQIKDGVKRKKLAELCGPQEKVWRCGAFFVICGDTRRHRLACRRDGLAYDAKHEAYLLSVIDATLFAQNFVLALESMGYGICYIGGLRLHLFEVDRVLELPEGVYPLYGLCVGVPDESPMPRPRFAPEAILFEDRYPTDNEVFESLADYDGTYEAYLKDRGATPKAWSRVMTEKFSEPRRVDVGAYYRSKGAVME